MRIADKIFEIVSRYTDTVFFLPGSGAMYLVDALGKSKLHPVACLHEQGAAYAAVGYALATDGLGVCLTTSGPGATNAISGCLAAWMDSIPVLFISGQVRKGLSAEGTGLRSKGMQEADIIKVVRPITRWAFRVDVDAGDVLPRLIADALSGRRAPIWIDVPQDVQGMEL